MSGSPRFFFAWVLSWSKHTVHTSISTHVASWPSRGLCYKMGPESHIKPRRVSINTQSLAQPQKADESCPSLPCLHSFQARPEADQLLNRSRLCWMFVCHVRKPKNLCISTKLKYTYLNRYACSKLARQRLMQQGGPRVTEAVSRLLLIEIDLLAVLALPLKLQLFKILLNICTLPQRRGEDVVTRSRPLEPDDSSWLCPRSLCLYGAFYTNHGSVNGCPVAVAHARCPLWLFICMLISLQEGHLQTFDMAVGTQWFLAPFLGWILDSWQG